MPLGSPSQGSLIFTVVTLAISSHPLSRPWLDLWALPPRKPDRVPAAGRTRLCGSACLEPGKGLAGPACAVLVSPRRLPGTPGAAVRCCDVAAGPLGPALGPPDAPSPRR